MCFDLKKKRAYISQIFRLKLCLIGNRTLCRPIQSVILLVIKHDYRPNWTPLSPVTITYNGAPWVRKCGRLPIRFGNHVTLHRPTARPSVRTTGMPMLINSINRYGNPNVARGYFDRKSHSHPRLVKQRKQQSQ